MERKHIQRICQIGVFAALVFVTSGIRLVIPVGLGNTALHLGNVLCLLSGLLLGPVPGGLAAGIGSGIYDLTNPLYVASAPFTFAFKFLLGCTAGAIAHHGDLKGENLRWNLIGSVAGSLTYTALYVTRSFLTAVLFKNMVVATALLETSQKLLASATNGLIAVVAAVPLSLAISAALKRAGLRIA